MKILLKSKLTIVILSIFVFSGFATMQTKACEIEFEIIKGKKETYQKGDILIIKIKVTLTHRACPVALKKTKFKMNGLSVVGATDWKQISAMHYERKLKVKVLSNKDGKVVITAIRTCDKDGGFGSLELLAVPKE